MRPPLNRFWMRALVRKFRVFSDGNGGRVPVAEVFYVDRGDVQKVTEFSCLLVAFPEIIDVLT